MSSHSGNNSIENQTNMDNGEASIMGEMVKKDLSYRIEGKIFNSLVVYRKESSGLLPVVMVIPEWWGLNDFSIGKAEEYAEMGYFVLAMDFYGDRKSVETPEEAGSLAGPYYENSVYAKQVFDAGKNALKEFPNADLSSVAVVGYCFGGAMALNMGRQDPQLKAVISVHGNLMTGVKAKHSNVKFLVLNGQDDTYVPREEVAAFKAEMESAQVDYVFIDYPGALHAFTNPASDYYAEKFNLPIAYHEEATQKSQNEIKAFLSKVLK